MTAIVKFLVTLLISLFFVSCNFDYSITGVKGNGNVVTQKRLTDATFSKVKATEGLNVYLTQSTNNSVKVQADDNLQDLIVTEIKDDVLYIHTKETIGKASAKKVLVNFISLNSIASNSGADVYSTNKIKSDNLKLSATSGSDMELDLDSHTITCSTSSGADIIVSGKANSITADASSGSSINALRLTTQNCTVSASSGADIDVNCLTAITAKATSGADISYSGSPEQVSKSKNSSGSVSTR